MTPTAHVPSLIWVVSATILGVPLTQLPQFLVEKALSVFRIVTTVGPAGLSLANKSENSPLVPLSRSQ